MKFSWIRIKLKKGNNIISLAFCDWYLEELIKDIYDFINDGNFIIYSILDDIAKYTVNYEKLEIQNIL